MEKDTLKGYLIEEVLAYLIRNTGYKLLVDPKQDKRELGWERNGLVVKGRGATHQVDVLGELEWIPAFTYPLRLIIEAKFRKKPTSIDIVRNAVGVLFDVNQNNSPTREQKTFYPKYQYAYAIASTSGFSQPAMNMAIAHQISLIDLSISEYDSLKSSIVQSAENVLESISDYNVKRGKLISNIRYALRSELRTLPDEEFEHRLPNNFDSYLSERLQPLVDTAKEHDELFVAMANGPFMLILKADDPQRFLNYANENPSHRVSINWSSETDKEIWVIRPFENGNAYRLSFRLPEMLSKWIFDIHKKRKERAIHVKKKYLSNITIYRHVDGKDCLFRLKFDLESTQKHASGKYR